MAGILQTWAAACDQFEHQFWTISLSAHHVAASVIQSDRAASFKNFRLGCWDLGGVMDFLSKNILPGLTLEQQLYGSNL